MKKARKTALKALAPSASSFLINLLGGFCYIASVFISLKIDPDREVIHLCLTGLASAIIPIALCELYFLKVHRRKRVDLHPPRGKNRERLAVKFLGYYASLAFVFFLYILIPEYKDLLYHDALMILLPVLIAYIIGGWLYFVEFDPRMKDPEDGYWHFGNFLLGRWKNIDRAKITAHLRSLVLRAYFLPVMLGYFVLNTSMFMKGRDAMIHEVMPEMEPVAGIWILKAMIMVYFIFACIDTLFATIGYLMAAKVLDTDIQSTEPTFFGWFICLICYAPFWEMLIIKSYFWNLYDNPAWHEWLAGFPTWIIAAWGVMTISFMCLESLTTLTFGMRFSNLTYRGLITAGPFRYTKHPQYIFKMLNRFFFLMPFLSLFGLFGAMQNLIMFAGVCMIYFLRARTEENHLSRYPEYVEYAKWINQHGVLKPLAAKLPFLKYSETRAKTGRFI